MTKFNYVQGFAVVALVLVGCGGGEGSTGGGDEKTPKPVSTAQPAQPAQPTGSTDPTTPAQPDKSKGAVCAVKGDKGNALGVGAFCQKGDTCSGGLFCTADFSAPEGAQFCTLACATDADCGADATCYHEARGQGCVPTKCVP